MTFLAWVAAWTLILTTVWWAINRTFSGSSRLPGKSCCSPESDKKKQRKNIRAKVEI
jgi:hypothetical protein